MRRDVRFRMFSCGAMRFPFILGTVPGYPCCMPFHPDPELRQAFNGYQGPDPATSRLIFLGKDANFPLWPENQPAQQDTTQRNHVLAFLGGQLWAENIEFRESIQYLSRNLYRNRAHHPLLLRCFPSNAPGLKYHQTMASLFDRIIDRLQSHGEHNLAESLITKDSAFVELCRFPTTGNNGEHARLLFGGDTPNGSESDDTFRDQQRKHRDKVLPAWLLNSERSSNNPRCCVVLPKSVFKVLCQANWQGLTMGSFRQCNNVLVQDEIVRIDLQPPQLIQLPGPFQNCRWFVTDSFPYFHGKSAHEIGAALTNLGSELANALHEGHRIG